MKIARGFLALVLLGVTGVACDDSEELAAKAKAEAAAARPRRPNAPQTTRRRKPPAKCALPMPRQHPREQKPAARCKRI